MFLTFFFAYIKKKHYLCTALPKTSTENKMKKFYDSLLRCLLFAACIVGNVNCLIGQEKNPDIAAFEERRTKAFSEKDWEALFAIEKEFDVYYDDVTHRTPEAKFEYTILKLYVSYGYMNAKNYAQAEQTLLDALELAENFQKTKLRIYSTLSLCYSQMAMAKEAYDNYSDAIQYSLFAISYAQMCGNNERVISQNITLGKEYVYIQEYDKARACFLQAKKIIDDIGDTKLFTAKLAFEEAQLEKKLENYRQTIELLEKAYALYDGSSDPNRVNHLIAIADNMASVYRFSLHNEEKASYWDNKITELEQHDNNTAGSELLRYKEWISKVIRLASSGKHEEAVAQYTQIIQELEKKTSIDNNYIMADCYDSRAICYMSLKRYKEAIADYNAAIILYKSLNENASLVDCYTYLGYAYYHEGDLGKTIEAEKNALAIAETIYDEDSDKLAECYLTVANIYAFHGDTLLAKQHLLKATDINERKIKKTFSYLTAQERNNYWAGKQNDILNIQPFLMKFGETQSEYTDALYDVQLLSKGLLLQSDIELQLLSSRSPQLQSLLTEVMQIRKTILQEKLPADSIRMLKREAEKIERELTVSSSEVGDFLHFLDITQSDVKQHLPMHAIAIEFATFKYGKDSLLTVAYVMKKDWEHVKMIPLYEERDILPLLGSERNKANMNRLYSHNANGAKLSQMIWSPILPYIQPDDTVYFAPSGLLHVLAVEALPYDATHTMADTYNLVRLSSTRELALRKEPITHKTATLYGDIRYGVSPDKMYANHIKYNNPDIPQDLVWDARMVGNVQAADLLATKVEVETIAPILQRQGIQVQVFSADTANEESFKALSGTQQNILHLATHGFYAPDKNQATDPMECCGLLFAGANTALAGDRNRLHEGVHDGVLTAKEISLLNLRDADIVVLSACETGLGDVTGEGVFGLQRGFKMAGAQTILMALWKVNDDATRLLMTSFYRHYAKGLSKRESFRKAQQEVRNYNGTEASEDDRTAAQDNFRNRNKKTETTTTATPNSQSEKENKDEHPYADPYYWAGFILLD